MQESIWTNDAENAIIFKIENEIFYFKKDNNWHTGDWEVNYNESGKIILSFPAINIIDAIYMGSDKNTLTFDHPGGALFFRKL